MAQKDSRRGAPRVEVNREFKSLDSFVFEYVTNLSRTGAFIRCDDPLPIGTRVRLKFSVIANEIETVEGIGEVARVVTPREATRAQPAGMGVVFVDLTPPSRAVVERITADGGEAAVHGEAEPSPPAGPGSRRRKA